MVKAKNGRLLADRAPLPREISQISLSRLYRRPAKAVNQLAPEPHRLLWYFTELLQFRLIH